MYFVVAIFNYKKYDYVFSTVKSRTSANKKMDRCGNPMSFIGLVKDDECTTIVHCPVNSDGGLLEFQLINAYLQGLKTHKG